MPSAPRRRFHLVLSFALLGSPLLAGCGSSHERFVQVRAADDFECTADSIRVEEVARSRYMARGCGKQGEYICSATPDGVDCSQSSDLDVESPSRVAPSAPAASSGP